MQIADGRIELRLVNLAQHLGINHAVDEGDQGIHHIIRRIFHPFGEFNILRDDFWKRRVIDFLDIALNSHQLRDGGLLVDFFKISFGFLQFVLGLIFVSFEVLNCTVGRALDKLLSQLQSFRLFHIGCNLPDDHIAGIEKFTGVEGTGIKTVVVEEVHHNIALRKEIEQLRVQIHFAKKVKRINVIDGNRHPLILPVLRILEHDGIVFAADSAGLKDVIIAHFNHT